MRDTQPQNPQPTVSPSPHALVLTPDLPPGVGGIQTFVARLVAHFPHLRTTVVTPAHAGAAEADRTLPAEIHRIGWDGLPHIAAVAAMNAAAVPLGLRARPDVVLSAHVVCAPAAAMLRRLAGVPYVQLLHANEMGARPGLTRFACARAASVVAVSRYTADEAQALGAAPERITIINPGTDLGPPPRPDPPRTPTIVTVARMRDDYKGHDVLLDALPLVREQVPGVRWVVIGDGPLRAGLEARAAERGLADRVAFLGRVSDEERDAHLDGARVFAMPSRIPDGPLMGEGFGIVLVEAGARGLPVVAGGVGGALDAVRDGETGLLVDPTDPAAVASALVRVLSDDALAARLASGGRAFAEQLAWPLVAERFEQELLRVAGARRAS